jgi:cytosine/uracil/thiamine/allantoin permease
MFAAISGLYVNPAYYFSIPEWLNEVTDHTQDSYHYGADFSVFLGMAVGALVYLILASRAVRKQADEQDLLLKAEGLL